MLYPQSRSEKLNTALFRHPAQESARLLPVGMLASMIPEKAGECA